jgi:hypothetical protein
VSYREYLEAMDADARDRARAENMARAERRRRWARLATFALTEGLTTALAVAALVVGYYAFVWLAERVIP